MVHVILVTALLLLSACSERRYQYKTEKEWVAALYSNQEQQRIWAADALGAMEAKSSDARRALVSALDDRSATVRVYAAKSLARFTEGRDRRTAILEMLWRVVADSSSGAHLAAVEALGLEEYRDERSVPPLVAALRHRSAATRAAAAATLGQFGGKAKAAESALEAALRDSDEIVQHEARDALAAITGSRTH